jgi:hypothetical protein
MKRLTETRLAPRDQRHCGLRLPDVVPKKGQLSLPIIAATHLARYYGCGRADMDRVEAGFMMSAITGAMLLIGLLVMF